MIETWNEHAQKQALIEQIRNAVAAQRSKAGELQGKPRFDLPFSSLTELKQALQSSGRDVGREPNIHAIVVDQPYPPCVTPVAGLSTISIKDLRLETRHEGSVLIARRVGKVVIKAVGATYGIENPDGTVEMLIFDGFNYPGDDILPADSILAIKHPYCKVDVRGMPRIKVSHPGDLVVLAPTEDIVPLDWRLDGVVISDTAKAAPATYRRPTPHSPDEIAADLSKTEIRPSQYAGRGLFSQQSFKAGEIVHAERAAFTLFKDDPRTYHALEFDTRKNMMTEDTLGVPFKELARHLTQNPTVLDEVTKLFAGGIAAPCKSGTTVDRAPVLDIFHIHEIWSKNAIACPAPQSSPARAFPNRVSEQSEPGSGLWIHTAYVNHSCLPNTDKSIIGDLLVLRAVRDIQKDEEDTMSYGCESSDQQEKQKAFRRVWDFECTCPLCSADERIGSQVTQERQQARYELSGPLPAKVDEGLVSRTLELLQTMEKTYHIQQNAAGSGTKLYEDLPKLGIAEAYFKLVSIYGRLGEADNAEQMLLRALAELNIVMLKEGGSFRLESGNWLIDEATVLNFLLLADLFAARRQSKVSQDLVEVARKFYLTLNGTMAGFEHLAAPDIGVPRTST